MNDENLVNYDSLSYQLSALIQKEVDLALRNESKIQSAVVDFVSDDGRIAVHFPPSTTIYTGVMNLSIYKFEPGSAVKILKEKNNTSNMWVIGSFNEKQFGTAKRFVETDLAETILKDLLSSFKYLPLKDNNIFKEDYIEIGNFLGNFLATCEFSDDIENGGLIISASSKDSTLLGKIDTLNGEVNLLKTKIASLEIKIKNLSGPMDLTQLREKIEELERKSIDDIVDSIISNLSALDMIAVGIAESGGLIALQTFILDALNSDPLNSNILDAIQNKIDTSVGEYISTNGFNSKINFMLENQIGDRVEEYCDSSGFADRINRIYLEYELKIDIDTISRRIILAFFDNESYKNNLLSDLLFSVKQNSDPKLEKTIIAVFDKMLEDYVNESLGYKVVCQLISYWVMEQGWYQEASREVSAICETHADNLVTIYSSQAETRIESAILLKLSEQNYGIKDLEEKLASNLIEDQQIQDSIFNVMEEKVTKEVLGKITGMELSDIFGNFSKVSGEYQAFYQMTINTLKEDFVDNLEEEGFFSLARNGSLANAIIEHFSDDDFDRFSYGVAKNIGRDLAPYLADYVIDNNVNMLNESTLMLMYNNMVYGDKLKLFLKYLADSIGSNIDLFSAQDRQSLISYIKTKTTLEILGGFEEFSEALAGAMAKNLSFQDFTPAQQGNIINLLEACAYDGRLTLDIGGEDGALFREYIATQYVTLDKYILEEEERESVLDQIKLNLIDVDGKFNDSLSGVIGKELAELLNTEEQLPILLASIQDNEVCRESFYEQLIERNRVLVRLDLFDVEAQKEFSSQLANNINLDNLDPGELRSIYNGIGQGYFSNQKDSITSLIRNDPLYIEDIKNGITDMFDEDVEVRQSILKASSEAIGQEFCKDMNRTQDLYRYFTGEGFSLLARSLGEILSAMFSVSKFSQENQREIARDMIDAFTSNEDYRESILKGISSHLSSYFFKNYKEDFKGALSQSLSYKEQDKNSIVQNMTDNMMNNGEDRHDIIKNISSEIAVNILSENSDLAEYISENILSDEDYRLTLMETVASRYKLGGDAEAFFVNQISNNEGVINKIKDSITATTVGRTVADIIRTNYDDFPELNETLSTNIINAMTTEITPNGNTYLWDFLYQQLGNENAIQGKIAEKLLFSRVPYDSQNRIVLDILFSKMSELLSLKDVIEVIPVNGNFMSSFASSLIRGIYKTYYYTNEQNRDVSNDVMVTDKILRTMLGIETDPYTGLEASEPPEVPTQYMKYFMEKMAEDSRMYDRMINGSQFNRQLANVLVESESHTSFMREMFSQNISDVVKEFFQGSGWMDEESGEWRYANEEIYRNLTEEDNWNNFTNKLAEDVSAAVTTPFTSLLNKTEAWNTSQLYGLEFEDQNWNKKTFGVNNEFIEYNIEGYYPYSHYTLNEQNKCEDLIDMSIHRESANNAQFYILRGASKIYIDGIVSDKCLMNFNGSSKWREEIIDGEGYSVCRLGVHLPALLPVIYDVNITVNEDKSTGIFKSWANYLSRITFKYLSGFTETIPFGDGESDKIDVRGFYIDVYIKNYSPGGYNLDYFKSHSSIYSRQSLLSLDINIKGGM